MNKAETHNGRTRTAGPFGRMRPKRTSDKTIIEQPSVEVKDSMFSAEVFEALGRVDNATPSPRRQDNHLHTYLRKHRRKRFQC